MAETFDYQLFGLRIRSEIALPELVPADGEGTPDVSVGRGIVPEVELVGGLQFDGEALVLTIPQVGRYRIAAGREIRVDANPGTPERNVRLYLLGSAFGALLHQRGLLPLHASAIGFGRRAVAFMGEAGAGKSTLAAAFHQRGHPVYSDDVCVVRFDPRGEPMVLAGLPRLRLWQETLDRMGRDASGLDRSYVGETDWKKFDLPIAAVDQEFQEVSLAAIYLLERGDSPGISRLENLEAAEAIFAHTYRGQFVSAVKGEHSHWAASTQLVQKTPIYRLSRKWGFEHTEVDADRIVAHVASLVDIQLDDTAETRGL